MVRLNGFTVIELLVAVTIIGLLVGGAIAAYTKFNERQVLLQAGKDLVVNMRKAQSRASAGVRDETVCQGLKGYRMIVDQTYRLSYVIFPECETGSAAFSTVITLPKGLAFTTGQNVFFQGLTGGIESQYPTITLRYGASYYVVEVTSGGSLNDKGLQ